MIYGLTGLAEVVPIFDWFASTVACVVYSEWIARDGVPKELHSNRVVQFESNVFAELIALFGIDKSKISLDYQQANRKCEQFNRTFNVTLRREVQKRPFD